MSQVWGKKEVYHCSVFKVLPQIQAGQTQSNQARNRPNKSVT
uniref:Uncharacterized protein n=1 Tax=Anguilla anguilla TaxID=7936 RepID=A0A0E9WLF9_ANGAN